MSSINSWNTSVPAQVSFGGTGNASWGTNGVVITNNVSPLGKTAPGLAGQVLIGATGAAPAFNTITSTGGTITFTPGVNTLNMEAAGGAFGIAWVEVTGASQAMAINTGYIANHASLLTFTLPTVAAVGSIVRVVGKGAGGWSITYTTNQIIHFGAVNTTITTGSLSSSQQYDAVELVCTVANLAWTVASGPQGNLTYV